MSTVDRLSSLSSRSLSLSPSRSGGSPMTENTIFVAVSRKVEESTLVLLWALENHENSQICILHVHPLDKFIVTPMGKLPAKFANKALIDAHRSREREELCEILDKYLQICRQFQVKAGKIYVEVESAQMIQEGIVKLLIEKKIEKLVIGAAANGSRYDRDRSDIRSVKARYVNDHAPGHCRIWFVCNKLLIYTREPTVRLEGNEGLAPYPPQEVGGFSSARSSSVGEQVVPEPAEMQKMLDRIPSAPNPPFSHSESDRHNNVNTWIPPPHLLITQSTSMPREPEGFYLAELERLKNDNDKISKELEAARRQKWLLESKIENFDSRVKELEKELEFTAYLGENYRKDRDNMQRERDTAITQVREVRNQLNEGASSADFLLFCSGFTSLELEKATNNFDPSLKVGEDAYGIIQKGVFHLTVNIPHPDSSLTSQEFRQEVEILCKLRHPNIVNLIGICPESRALIYEHCFKQTIEDRVNNIDQETPFLWQIRVRIATELRNALAFLHSHKPNSIIHGDLRPENIHLDSNDTCKLSGFKISNAISNGKFSLDNKSSFYRGDSEARSYPYLDPEFFAGGDLTTKSDVYAFGVILLRLLTGKQAVRLARQVQNAVERDELSNLLDTSAEWPLEQAKQLAELALRCCEMNQSRRPDLEDDVWKVLDSFIM